ncbi:hypothetical protein GA0070613_5096 [Micromonospora inositola]|uniref:Uncharacterized protein n=1 Tax=Micromonospora inositola TaxID=47865 RepID=A0A1C5JPR2_9ACTN|nr:hypothetical protein GA0070613_5096 [Micromonospora inositola]
MTTAEPPQSRPNLGRGAWRGFRRWRRTRPFWGGLLTALAGLEIFGTTQKSARGLTFQMGPTGFLSWLIPTILVTCALLMWLRPQQRIFYAVVAAVTVLFSLIGVNLGGFFLGLLLGTVGSALGFAWVPGPPTERPDGGPADDGTIRDESPDDATEHDRSADDETVRREQKADGSRDLPAKDPAPKGPIANSRPSSTS